MSRPCDKNGLLVEEPIKSTRQERFEQACREPVDLDQCYKALQRLIDREHTMHIPPQIDDEDILISRALWELKELRENIGPTESA